ncbi:MAG TPA: DUF805 domain-containing protein [Burkholderiaceae bacterium]
MNPVNACIHCLARYAEFHGRAPRAEFWWFALATVLLSVVASYVHETAGAAVLLLTLVPSFAVGARRLHDTGRSGWWQLLWLVPVLGWLPLIYFFAQGSKVPV